MMSNLKCFRCLMGAATFLCEFSDKRRRFAGSILIGPACTIAKGQIRGCGNASQKP